MGNFAFFLAEKRKCIVCGKEYIPTSKAQKTCCMECRKKYYKSKGYSEKQATAGKNKSIVFNHTGLKRKQVVEAHMKKTLDLINEADAHGMSYGAYKEKLRREGRLDL